MRATHLERFSEEEALLDVVLLAVDGVDVLDPGVAAGDLAVLLQSLARRR